MGLTEQVDLFNSNILFLIELNLLEKYKMVVNNIENVLHSPFFGCKDLFSRKRGKLYLERETNHNILCTYSKLIKLHHKFFHPSTDKLFNLFKIARSWQADGVTK